jgi:hypothetical protein
LAIEFQIDRARGVVFAHASAKIEIGEMFDFAARLRADPAFHPNLNALLDMSELTGLEASFEGLRHFAQAKDGDPFSANSRCVAVAPQDFAYGVARMYQTLREKQGDFQVVRTMEQAHKLLGIGQAAAVQ